MPFPGRRNENHFNLELSQWPFWHDQQDLIAPGSSLICKMPVVTIFKKKPRRAMVPIVSRCGMDQLTRGETWQQGTSLNPFCAVWAKPRLFGHPQQRDGGAGSTRRTKTRDVTCASIFWLMSIIYSVHRNVSAGGTVSSAACREKKAGWLVE